MSPTTKGTGGYTPKAPKNLCGQFSLAELIIIKSKCFPDKIIGKMLKRTAGSIRTARKNIRSGYFQDRFPELY